jgi:tetratricopeptide (TPR) repeat protein
MLGINQVYGGHAKKSADLFAHLLDVAEKQTPRQDEVIAEICLNYGESVMALEQFDQARTLIDRTRVFIKGYAGAQPSLAVETFSSLGLIDASTGKFDDAEKVLNEGMAYAASHKIEDTSLMHARLGYVHLLKGDVDGALAIGKQSLDEALKTNGEHSLDTADVHYFLGRALVAAGHAAEAQAEYRASIASHTALLPPDGMHFWSANSRLALGEMLVQNPQSRDEGTRLIDQGVSLREETLGHDNPHTIEARQLQAKVHSMP